MIMPRVLFASEWLPAYRVSFYDALRAQLAERGIEVAVVHGDPPPQIAARGTGSGLDWGTYRRNRVIPVGRRSLVWQPVTDVAARSDLVIVEQASRLLVNYWLLTGQLLGRTRLALWGHGANLNQLNSSSAAEWIKRRISQWPHWWFAYTEGTRDRVTALGYPADRITVTQNASETNTLREALDRLDPNHEHMLRRHLGLGDGPIGLFVGSLYPEKRLDFLIAAAETVVARVPDFVLVIAGDGPSRDSVAKAAASRRHVIWTGHVDGVLKASLLRCASALLVPGALGLVVVDGFVAGLPVVSTAVPTHGPELEYIRDGENGRLLGAQATPREYADAVIGVLHDGHELRNGAARSSAMYSAETMVSRFSDGITRALTAPPLGRPHLSRC